MHIFYFSAFFVISSLVLVCLVSCYSYFLLSSSFLLNSHSLVQYVHLFCPLVTCFVISLLILIFTSCHLLSYPLSYVHLSSAFFCPANSYYYVCHMLYFVLLTSVILFSSLTVSYIGLLQLSCQLLCYGCKLPDRHK